MRESEPPLQRSQILHLRTLNCEEFSNYRPITNIAFLSKTIERAAAAQTLNYLTKKNLLAKFQSTYRQFHSTETALLRVCNDILQAIDEGQEVVLVLLDLSSAFDTIDHKVLLADRLRIRYGFSGTVLDWFRSYLSNRTQSVKIGKDLSAESEQGPIWSPARFRAGTSPVLFIFRSC